MIIRNKKHGSNVLAYRAGIENVRLKIKAGEQVNIPGLVEFNQVINKADFDKNRGWFEVIENLEVIIAEEESSLEKAEKQVREYTSEKKKKETIK